MTISESLIKQCTDEMQHIIKKEIQDKYFVGHGDTTLNHMKIMVYEFFDKKLFVKLKFNNICVKFSNYGDINGQINDDDKMIKYWKHLDLNLRNLSETTIPVLMFY